MLKHYILDERGEPVEAPLFTWAAWYESADRQLVETFVGDVRVSTVFLGTDHDFTGQGPPVLWETMIFGGPLDGWQDRYSSRQAALAGHEAAVALAQQATATCP